MEGLSNLAVYATALASPVGGVHPNLLGGLSGAGDLLALLGVIVALVPVALVIRGEGRRRVLPSRRRRARRGIVPAAGSSPAGGSL